MKYSAFKDKVFLTQTDTTIGFVSQNADKLTHIKQRPSSKHYITAVNSLATLKTLTRIPNSHKNRVRKATKTTFVMPNKHSFRVTQDRQHLLLLDRLQWAFTSSANLSNQTYDESFAMNATECIIEPLGDFKQASLIYELGNITLKRIR